MKTCWVYVKRYFHPTTEDDCGCSPRLTSQGGNNIFQSYYYDYEQVSSLIFIFAHGIKNIIIHSAWSLCWLLEIHTVLNVLQEAWTDDWLILDNMLTHSLKKAADDLIINTHVRAKCVDA